MSTIRSTTQRSTTRRVATALVGAVAGIGLLVGCGSSANTGTEQESPSGRVSFDEEQVRRELILFENRRAAWAKQYAESRESSTNVKPPEHPAHVKPPEQ